MKVSFCSICGKDTGHQRKLGFGTFFAVLLTGGFWLLALPFYPQRCTICGSEAASSDYSFSRPLDAPVPSYTHPSVTLDDETKKCPHCAEIIKLEARKCRFCGETLDPHQVEEDIAARRTQLAAQNALEAQGQKQCPRCQRWDVHRAYIEDGGQGDWCPHCQMSLQKMTRLSPTPNP